MTQNLRTFLPFGEFLPDRRLLNNEGLVRAYGVVPVSGNYVQASNIDLPGGTNALGGLGTDASGRNDNAFGFFPYETFESGLRQQYGYYGAKDALYEIDISAGSPLSETDRSRAAGYSFATTPPTIHDMWRFTAYGDNVVATNFNDEVQYLPTPGTGLFSDMITSTFAPQARFAFPIRQNLFLAYIFTAASYDGISAGTHPATVCWSMNDNVRAYGSENVDPALIGAGYQQAVGGDLGPITAAIGGSFGIIFCSKGIVRVDGPPYEFRTLVEGDTTIHPYSVFRFGEDIYFWGVGGPSVLVGGEAPVLRLAKGKAQRSLLDNATGFGQGFAASATAGPRGISGGPDPANELVRWAYPPIEDADAAAGLAAEDSAPPSLLFDYSLSEGRLTVSRSIDVLITEPQPAIAAHDCFLSYLPVEEGTPWGPFGQLIGLKENYQDTEENWYLFRYRTAGGLGNAPRMELQTGYGKLGQLETSRVVSVRPVWSNTAGLASSIEALTTIQVHTRNKPWEDETSSTAHSTFNSDGWIATPTAKTGVYHSLHLIFDGADADEIHEVEGLEVQFSSGGSYGS